MGQAQSHPEKKNSSSCDATPDAAGPKKRVKELKVPTNWKNDADFHQISPISDISNPSQFRGRLHHNNNNNHNNAPAGSAVRANANRRTSKVCPKQPPPKAGAVPAPANFYFPVSHKEDSVSATSSEQQQQQQQQQPKQQQKQPEQQPPPEQQARERTWMATWKAKCAKAKQQMGECFHSRNETDLEQPFHPENHHQQQVPDDKYAAKQSNKAYLQFEPVWKEEGGLLSPRGSRKEPSYVHRLSGTESGTQLSSKDESEKEQLAANRGFSAKGPAVGSTVMQRIQSLQQASGASVGAPSFQPNRLSVGTTKSSNSSNSSNSNSNNNNNNNSSGGQRHPESNPMQRGRDPRPVKSSYNHHHQRLATERKQARSSSESNPRNTKSHGSKKEAAIRDGSAQIFRTASAESLHGTKRASIGRSFSNGSNNNNNERDDERRTSIQEQVQRQIDAQKSGRVQRLRQQYQEQMHLEKENANKHRRSQSVPGRVSAGHSLPARKQEHKKEVEQKQQQQQQPKKKQSLSSNATTGRKSRSASVPRARPSIDGSALLHLTGWTDNNCFAKKEQSIPALLKVAGWKPPPKASDNRPEKAPTVVERGQKEESRRPTRVSEPTKESAKEYHRSVKRTQSDGGCMPLKSAPQKSAPTHMKRTEEALKDSKEELDGDSPQPKLFSANPIGKPLAYMLQQAYFQGDDDDFRRSTLPSPFVNKYGDAGGQSPSNESNMSSSSTASSGPLVSNQALYNGEFLFTNNPNVLVAPQPSYESAGHSISTLNSRNRVSAFSGQPVTIRRTSSNDNSSLTSASSGDYRRVRFSDELVVDRSNENLIERQMSDLTDVTGATTTTITRPSMMSIPRIDSIPEDDAEDAISKSPAPPSIMDSVSVTEDGPVAVFEDTDEDDEEEEEDNQASSPTSPVMRWSYHTENGLMKGVTPMINGKSSSNVHHATKSPYLRFKEAKGKFTVTKAHKESPAKKRVSPAKKRASPAKRGSLVSSRIAAMEGRRARSETGTTTKIIMPRKVRRPTMGDQVLAPRKGSLVSPLFKHQSLNISKKQEPLKPSASEKDAQSPTLIDGHVIGSPPTAAHRENSDASTVVSLEEEADAFGDICHPTTIDEDDSSSDESESDDDFDNLLQNARGMSVHDEGSSYQQSSIGSTILRGPRFSMSSSTSPHSTGTETRSVASTVVVQRRPSPASIFSSGSSLGDSASMPSALRRKDENLVPSAVGRMMQNQQFPFRETAKVVKPNEQTHRAVTGSNTISQMQRTPMEARTWRALAAAAQDKKRNNLSERNLNAACVPKGSW